MDRALSLSAGGGGARDEFILEGKKDADFQGLVGRTTSGSVGRCLTRSGWIDWGHRAVVPVSDSSDGYYWNYSGSKDSASDGSTWRCPDSGSAERDANAIESTMQARSEGRQAARQMGELAPSTQEDQLTHAAGQTFPGTDREFQTPTAQLAELYFKWLLQDMPGFLFTHQDLSRVSAASVDCWGHYAGRMDALLHGV